MKIASYFAPVLFLLAGPALLADSYYSTFGLGMPQYYVSAQSAGMGGAGIGIQQHLSPNSLNLAAIDLRGFTMINASFQGEMVDNTFNQSTITTRQGNAAGFQFAFPMYKNRFAVMASLRPLVRTQLTLDFEQDWNDFIVRRTIKSSGGISAASLGLKYAILPNVHVGGLFNFNFGAYNEVWKTEFDDDTYNDTSEDITSHVRGAGAELGLLVQPASYLSIGGVIKAASSLDIETTTITGSGLTLAPVKQSAAFPLAYGLGVAANVHKFMLAADIYAQDWADYKLDGQTSAALTNYLRFGGGVEFVNSADYLAAYFKRIAWRLGASYAQLPFRDSKGEQVTEMFVSAGMGFPFSRNVGRIDVALEYGERSSSADFPYSESLIRISASVTMAEKWFQRLY